MTVNFISHSVSKKVFVYVFNIRSVLFNEYLEYLFVRKTARITFAEKSD